MRIGMLVAAVWMAQAETPDAKELIRKAFSRNEDIFDAMRNYTYLREMEMRRLDGAGRVTDRDRKLHEVSILYGSPYFRLIEKDGKKLEGREAEKERQKLDREAAKRARRAGSAEEEKEREERRKALAEVAEAFEWKLVGEDTVSGRKVWAVDGRPRLAYQPKSREARIFQKMSGRMWISQGDYRMAKVEAKVDDTISWGLFLVRIQPGFRFSFEQARVNDEVWLPAKAHLKGAAKIGGVKTVRLELDTAYRGYRRFQSDSRVIAGGEQ